MTVADYISRAESESRQKTAKETKKNKKDAVSSHIIAACHFFDKWWPDVVCSYHKLSFPEEEVTTSLIVATNTID